MKEKDTSIGIFGQRAVQTVGIVFTLETAFLYSVGEINITPLIAAILLPALGNTAIEFYKSKK